MDPRINMLGGIMYSTSAKVTIIVREKMFELREEALALLDQKPELLPSSKKYRRQREIRSKIRSHYCDLLIHFYTTYGQPFSQTIQAIEKVHQAYIGKRFALKNYQASAEQTPQGTIKAIVPLSAQFRQRAKHDRYQHLDDWLNLVVIWDSKHRKLGKTRSIRLSTVQIISDE
jgi:hypothetical protein